MKTNNERNYGIDLLRIFSMVSVVILHNLYQGGILPQLKTNNPNWWQFWLLENLAIVAVNVFAMITGYVSMMHRFKSDRVLQVVFQTIFWSVTVSVTLYQLRMPISVETVKASFYPLAQFWYVNAGLKSIFETDFKRHSEPRLPSTAQINHQLRLITYLNPGKH
ncbi:acyltransferase family protein [Lacticaseibacillus paracasei]|uniref:acyltransferase family protein n=2 Tax=Lacticaseibacillus paracasei TaxID=1597 RepID=UPI002158115B|nr:acyltransferase family protein [Lacticaseibacillus paracasei]UVD34101.1 hypothetical protein MUB27_10230 [Lacticaseibacillus paracasei]